MEEKASAFLAFEEDIKGRGFRDWLKAHTSFMGPLRRYDGEINLTDAEIPFRGDDIKEEGQLELNIPRDKITAVYLGFDQVFKGREERAWPWNKPLRIRFEIDEGERTIYLYVEPWKGGKGLSTPKNKEWFELLKK